MVGCPVGSIQRNRDGTILIKDWCIGCGLCERNCPYGNITMHERVGKASAERIAITCDYWRLRWSRPLRVCLSARRGASNEGKRVAENRRTRNALERKLAPCSSPCLEFADLSVGSCRLPRSVSRLQSSGLLAARLLFPLPIPNPRANGPKSRAATSFLTQKCRAMSVLAVVPQRPATAA